MSHVYGDATPFPYDVDYIELSRRAIDCAVQLLSAQHAISAAHERGAASGAARDDDRTSLTVLSAAIESSLESFARADSRDPGRVLTRLRECLGSTVSTELAAIDQQASAESAQILNIVSRSSESARRAIEAFLLLHDLPGTELRLSWSAAGEQSYAAQLSVKTPFGIQAVFSLAIPPEHMWSRSRRLSELAPGFEVHSPQQAGWLSRRTEMAPVKLDRLYLSALTLGTASAEFSLRKGPTLGAGYRVILSSSEAQRVALQPLMEDGSPATDSPLDLDGADSAQMLRLCSRVVESTEGLSSLRRNMLSADLDDRPMDDVNWSQLVAERLIQLLAPVMNEIARRSGAPTELVLRRDLGGGRREEMYVTKAELYEKVLVLPPARRVAFEQLGLVEAPWAPEPARTSWPKVTFAPSVLQ
jgi:hypothetical protein